MLKAKKYFLKATAIDENNFDEKAKGDFLKGAKIAYESIITSFSSGELKKIKTLLDKKVFKKSVKLKNKKVTLFNKNILDSNKTYMNSLEVKKVLDFIDD